MAASGPAQRSAPAEIHQHLAAIALAMFYACENPFNASGEVYRVVPEPGSVEMALSVLLTLALVSQMERRTGRVSRRRLGDDGRA
jgi:hypothetical protein